jgi:hypothetical protein
MAKHATNTNAAALRVQAGFLQGSIASTLLPGTSIHAPTGVAFGGIFRTYTHISAPLKAQCE